MAVPDTRFTGIAWIPSLICAGLSVFLARSGLLSVFFFTPLGFIAYGYPPLTAWFCVVAAIVANGVYLVVFSQAFPVWECLYFSILAVVFVCIAAPPALSSRFLPRIRESYRFIIGCAIASALVLLTLNRENEEVRAFLVAQAEMLRERSITHTGTDVVQRSILEQYFTPETILATLEIVALRGGALFSCLLIFVLNQQVSLLLVKLIRRVNIGGDLAHFHVDSALIWVLSGSLLMVLAGRFFSFPLAEILGWNVLVCCALLYLVQGGGIVTYFLTLSPLPPFLRLTLNVLVVFSLFSPGLNFVVVGGVLLLGIAENWAPFRVSKTDGPSSTPGM
ncbi:MAG: YybS family protein [Treponema sp.]|jgi:hypothetical protein|nr:YybS family protein [Treponema sp.]